MRDCSAEKIDSAPHGIYHHWRSAIASGTGEFMRHISFSCILALAIPGLSSGLTLDLVTVGDPGNAPDPLNTNAIPGIGSVAYTYQIGKFEVKNSEYVEFLNAVAATDTYGLYDTRMGSDARGGISRSGSSGSFTYIERTGYATMPVTYVSFYDAVRFANWLENGQPTGTNQVAGVTESGSYTLFTNAENTTNVSARAANAKWVIPTENEWYKAAYYDPTAGGTTNYWLYPTRSDSTPNSRLPNSIDTNSANRWRDDGSPDDFLNDGYANTGATAFEMDANYLTDVGSYTLAASYYGTFDQGGNVWEWNETTRGSDRGIRGGAWGDSLDDSLRSSFQGFLPPLDDSNGFGFRIVAIPEPSCLIGILVAAVGVVVRTSRQQRRR